jgi:hypothetical protein
LGEAVAGGWYRSQVKFGRREFGDFVENDPGTRRIRTESGRLKLPQPVKVGHPGRANKAVPAGWIRRIVDARFALQ